jgi:hypothetical protein
MTIEKQISALQAAAKELFEAANGVNQYAGEPASLKNLEFDKQRIGNRADALHPVYKLCAQVTNTNSANIFFSTQNSFTWASAQRVNKDLHFEPQGNPDDAKARHKIEAYNKAAGNFILAYQNACHAKAEAINKPLAKAIENINQQCETESYAFVDSDKGKGVRVIFKSDKNDTEQTFLNSNSIIFYQDGPDNNLIYTYSLTFADEAAVEALNKTTTAKPTERDYRETQRLLGGLLKIPNNWKDTDKNAEYEFRKIDFDASKEQSVLTLTVPDVGRLALETWLGERFADAKLIQHANYAPPNVTPVNNILLADLDENGNHKTTNGHQFGITFTNLDAETKFNQSLQEFQKKHEATKLELKNISRILTGKLSQLTANGGKDKVEVPYANLDHSDLKYKVVLRVPSTHAERVNSFLTSAGRTEKCGAITAQSGANYSQVKLEFNDIDELEAFYKRIKEDHSIGYPMAAQAVETTPGGTVAPEVANIHNSLKNKLEELKKHFTSLTYTKSDGTKPKVTKTHPINEVYNGSKTYLALSFEAPPEFFTDDNGAPGPYELAFYRNKPKSDENFSVSYKNKRITILVNKTTEGLDAVNEYYEKLISPTYTAPKSTPAGEYVWRVGRGILAVAFLPLALLAVGFSAVVQAIAVSRRSDLNGKAFSQRTKNWRLEKENELIGAKTGWGKYFALQLYWLLGGASTLLEGITSRWQETSFNMPDWAWGGGKKMKLLNSNSGLNRNIGRLLLILNLFVDLLVAAMFLIARNVFGQDKDGKIEQQVKRYASWVWTSFVFGMASVATVTGIIYGVTFAFKGEGSGLAYLEVLEVLGDVMYWAVAGPLYELPRLLIEGNYWGEFENFLTTDAGIGLTSATGIIMVIAIVVLVVRASATADAPVTNLTSPLLTPTPGEKAEDENELQKQPSNFPAYDGPNLQDVNTPNSSATGSGVQFSNTNGAGNTPGQDQVQTSEQEATPEHVHKRPLY